MCIRDSSLTFFKLLLLFVLTGFTSLNLFRFLHSFPPIDGNIDRLISLLILLFKPFHSLQIPEFTLGIVRFLLNSFQFLFNLIVFLFNLRQFKAPIVVALSFKLFPFQLRQLPFLPFKLMFKLILFLFLFADQFLMNLFLDLLPFQLLLLLDKQQIFVLLIATITIEIVRWHFVRVRLVITYRTVTVGSFHYLILTDLKYRKNLLINHSNRISIKYKNYLFIISRSSSLASGKMNFSTLQANFTQTRLLKYRVLRF